MSSVVLRAVEEAVRLWSETKRSSSTRCRMVLEGLRRTSGGESGGR